MPERDWQNDWEACKGATPGPWRWGIDRLFRVVENPNPTANYYGDYNVIDLFRIPPVSLNVRHKEDRRFIAEARESLPYWLERVRELEEALRGLLLSADCSWEDRGEGHDWPEACEVARKVLGANQKGE